METMSRRERVLNAIEHKEVDRVPVMLEFEPHTTLKIADFIKSPKNIFHRIAMKGLSKISPYLPTKEMRDGAPLLAWLFQSEYPLELGADIIDNLFWINSSPAYFKFWLDKGKLRMKDMYGAVRGIGGLYLETFDIPCKTREDLDNYKFPDFSDPAYYKHIKQFRKKHPDVSIIVRCMGVQDCSQQFYKMENLYSGMIEHPQIIKKFFQKLTGHTIQTIKGSLQAGADIVEILDDYGTKLFPSGIPSIGASPLLALTKC